MHILHTNNSCLNKILHTCKYVCFRAKTRPIFLAHKPRNKSFNLTFALKQLELLNLHIIGAVSTTVIEKKCVGSAHKH